MHKNTSKNKMPMTKNKLTTNVAMAKVIKPILQQLISESGWVAGPVNNGSVLFNTPLLSKHIPKNGSKSWLNHQSFTFSIFYHKKFYLITKILPCNNKTRNLLSNALSNVNCLKKPKKNHVWVNHILHSINLSMSDFEGKNNSEIKKMLKKDWQILTAQVNKIEVEILKHTKDLKKLPPKPDTYYVQHSIQNSQFRIIRPKPAIRKLSSAA